MQILPPSGHELETEDTTTQMGSRPFFLWKPERKNKVTDFDRLWQFTTPNDRLNLSRLRKVTLRQVSQAAIVATLHCHK